MTAKRFDKYFLAFSLVFFSYSICASIAFSASNIIQNPGFELGTQGSSHWTQNSSNKNQLIRTDFPGNGHNGSDVFAFMGIENNIDDLIFQDVTLPASASSAYLDFYFQVQTKETTTSKIYDKLILEIYDPPNSSSPISVSIASNLDYTVGSNSWNLSASNVWRHYTGLDLSSHLGKTIRLAFRVTTDVSNASVFFVDDISLNIVIPPSNDTESPTVSTFIIPATANNGTISITSFTATDNTRVTGYLITEDSNKPTATAANWTTSAPTTYSASGLGNINQYALAKDSAGNSGSKNITLYAWAKDSAGNVSNALSRNVLSSMPTDSTCGNDLADLISILQNITSLPTSTPACQHQDRNDDGRIGLPEAIFILHKIAMKVWYKDQDGDGFGNPQVSINAIVPPDGFISDSTDCDDGNNTRYPNAPESCGGTIDMNCDGNPPLQCPSIWYQDNDNDGYSNGTTLSQITQPTGYKLATNLTSTSGDCDDANEARHPGATESCGGTIDMNCDGNPPLQCPSIWYQDNDNDGYSNGTTLRQVNQPTGYKLATNLTSTSGDCDDANEARHPGATESCGGTIDMNCDGNPPLQCPSIWYQDNDNDGYSNGTTRNQISQPYGYKLANNLSSTSGDCDDDDETRFPGALEICDGLDNDCVQTTPDGSSENWYNNSTTCGVGICSAYGTFLCQNGQQVNTCTEGTPKTEICGNKIDEDCNGQDLICKTPDLTGNWRVTIQNEIITYSRPHNHCSDTDSGKQLTMTIKDHGSYFFITATEPAGTLCSNVRGSVSNGIYSVQCTVPILPSMKISLTFSATSNNLINGNGNYTNWTDGIGVCNGKETFFGTRQ